MHLMGVKLSWQNGNLSGWARSMGVILLGRVLHFHLSLQGGSMKHHSWTRSVAIAVLAIASLAACQKKEASAGAGPAEQAGKQLDSAASKAGEELNKAAAKAGEKMQEAGQKLQEKASEAKSEADKKTQ
jgi:hypothetical protein